MQKRFEVWVDAHVGETKYYVDTREEADALVEFSERLAPDVEVAINDMHLQTTVWSNATTEA